MGIFDKEDNETSKSDAPKSTKNVHDDYNDRMTNGNSPDPSAKRNVGPGGDLQRNDQMDKLENMHIGGNETTGYGANDPDSRESISQGPGFSAEGSYEESDGSVNGIRRDEQPFGSKTTQPNENESGYKEL